MQLLLESIGLADTPENTLHVESAIEWLNAHTIYEIDKDSVKNIKSSVKLFILKFSELMTSHAGVASESISGMSQSFVTGQSLESKIYELAVSLLGSDAIKSTVTVFSGEDRWDYGG